MDWQARGRIEGIKMSDIIAGLLLVLLLAASVVGLFFLLFKRGRRRFGAALFFGPLLVTSVMATFIANADARKLGFTGSSDKLEAQRAGFTDASEWASHKIEAREKIEADKAAAASEAAEREQAARKAEDARKADDEVKRKEAEAAAQAKRAAEEERARLEKEAKEAAVQSKIAKDKRFGLNCLSSWDGSLVEFRDAIKAQMRDPDSFQHIETRVLPVDDRGRNTIMMNYRSRNGFGGMNVGQAIGEFSNSTCEMLSIIQVE